MQRPPEFFDVLIEMLERMAFRFDNFPAIREALNSATMFKNNRVARQSAASTWIELSAGNIDALLNRDQETVCRIIDECDFDMIKNIHLREILSNSLVERATKDSLLEYVRILTILSHRGTANEIPKEKIDATAADVVAAAAPIAPSAPSSSATAPIAPSAIGQKPVSASSSAIAPASAKEAIENVLDALPKFVETFNEIMARDGGNNPFAQMAKQFMNPNQLQTGVANNLAANALSQLQENPGIMEQVQAELGPQLTADSLKKLEEIENKAKQMSISQQAKQKKTSKKR
jgi:hypothetical protein